MKTITNYITTKVQFLSIILIIIISINNYCVLSIKQIKQFSLGVYLNENTNQQLNISVGFFSPLNYHSLDHLNYNFNIEQLPQNDPFMTSRSFCRLLEKSPNLVAVFMPESSIAVNPVVEHISSKLQLPYIQTNWTISSTYSGSKTSLNFYPDFDLLSEGLATIVSSLQWKSFAILYESNDSLFRLKDILKLQKYDNDKNRDRILLKKLDNFADSRAILKEIKQFGETRIILDCNIDATIEILQQAKSLGLLTQFHHYFFPSLDAHTLDLDQLESKANFTTVRLLNPEKDVFEEVVRDLNHYQFKFMELNDLEPFQIKTETALIYESIKLLIEAVSAIQQTQKIKFNNISCEKEDVFNLGPEIVSQMKTMAAGSLSGHLQFDHAGKRSNFTLNIIAGNRNKIIAAWNSALPEQIARMRTEEEREKEVIQTLQQGINLIASKIEEPYLMLKIPQNDDEILTGNDRYEGYVVDLIEKIAEIVDFKYEIYLVDGGTGGFNRNTKTWTGIIGEIIENKALFGIGDITISPQRESVVDFSMPFMRLGIGVLFKKPESTVSMFAFLNPLSPEVWMYTLTLYLSVSIILYFVARMAPGDWENPHPCNLTPDELENIWDIKNCLWLTMGSIMNQGSDILPKGISSRLVASMWWFFALIMTNSYIANLAAFLSNPKDSVISEIEDLAKQNQIKYGTLAGGTTQEFFQQSNYSTYRRMYANMMLTEPSPFVKTTADGIKRVKSTKEGRYAFLMESTTIDYLIERNCDLATAQNKWVQNKEYGIIMQLDSPYRGSINDAILHLQEKGKLSEIKNKWWHKMNRGPPCVTKQDGGDLNLENVGGIFLVLGIGLVLALLFGIFEFLWNVRKISVEDHISYWEAFQIEFMFALKVWISKKRCKNPAPPPVVENLSISRKNSNDGGATSNLKQSNKNYFSRTNLTNETGNSDD